MFEKLYDKDANNKLGFTSIIKWTINQYKYRAWSDNLLIILKYINIHPKCLSHNQ